MIKFLFTGYFLCISLLLLAQDYQLTWQNCFGGSEPDWAYDMTAVGNGYLIVGGSTSTDGNISGNIGMGDGWMVKVDSNGIMEWEKSIGGTNGDYIFRIIPTLNDNFYLLASSSSSDVDISYDPYPDSEDFWIVKIDIDGNIIWDKIVGGSYGDIIWNGSPTLDGGIVAVGWTYSTDGDVSVSYGGADTWAVKISSDGELEWDYTIGTDWIDKGQAILATADGGYLIASTSSIHDDAIGNITCTPHSYGFFECVLFKLDSNLNVEWQRCYGGTDNDGVLGLLEVADGYVFTGSVDSNDGDISGNHGDGDIWVVKIDFLGNIIWQKCLGGSRSEYANILYQTSNNEFIVAGSTRSNNGDVTGNHSMSEFDYDIWFVKLSCEGELLYQQCIGGAGSEELYFGVVQKSDNNFVIAGQTDYGPSYDVGCAPHGVYPDEDWWVFEIDLEDTTGIYEDIVMHDNLRVYPIPAKDYVTFEVQSPKFKVQGSQSAQIYITNIIGQEVATKQIISEKTVFDLRNWQQGVYFYSLEMEGKRYSGKVVIQK
jgi:hypothetical protein